MKQTIARRGLGPLCIGVLGTIWLLVPATRAEATDPAPPPTQASQPAPPADPAVNHCADCHEKEVLPISLGHSFHEWKGSLHGRAGVACEKCHGGDPSQSDPVAAHKGVLPASDPASMVSPEGVSKMCGSCHEKEYEAFLSTVHGELTKDDEARATCQTCHGSMATSLPSPAELRSRCAVCHDKNVEAQASLAVLANAKIQLFRTHRRLDQMRESDPKWYRGAMDRFHDLERSYGVIQLEWHTFEMKKVLRDSMNVLKLAKLLEEEAKLRVDLPRDDAAPAGDGKKTGSGK